MKIKELFEGANASALQKMADKIDGINGIAGMELDDDMLLIITKKKDYRTHGRILTKLGLENQVDIEDFENGMGAEVKFGGKKLVMSIIDMQSDRLIVFN